MQSSDPQAASLFDKPAAISHSAPALSNDDTAAEEARLRALTTAYYADPAGRTGFVRALFNGAARRYDAVNLLFSLGTGGWYRRYCLRRAGLRPGHLVVDVAVGTGLLAREALALTGGRTGVIGVDVSETMLALARRRLGIPLIQGAAEALPLAAGIADFVTMGYALRHLADLHAALREALRVLRPGGGIVLLEISPPRRRLGRLVAAVYIGGVLPLLSLLLGGDGKARALMRYHWRTIANYLPREAVLGAITATGFKNARCSSEFGLFRHYGGEKPGG